MSFSGDEGGYLDANAEDSEAELLEEVEIGPREAPEEDYVDENGVFHMGKVKECDLDFRGAYQPRKVEERVPRGLQVQGGSKNTGPKGVIADYNEAKFNLKSQRMMEAVRRERAMKQMAGGKTQYRLQQEADDPDLQRVKARGADDDDESSSDDSDDEIFASYRAERIQAYQASMPSFGKFVKMDVESFRGLTQSVHEATYVVAHLYQNHIEACIRLNLAFEELAQQFAHVCFVRVRADEAIPGYSDSGCPTLLVYRAGDMVHNFVRVQDSIPGGLADASIVGFLNQHKILHVPGAAAAKRAREDLERLKLQ